jgi:hypothetical protein
MLCYYIYYRVRRTMFVIPHVSAIALSVGQPPATPITYDAGINGSVRLRRLTAVSKSQLRQRNAPCMHGQIVNAATNRMRTYVPLHRPSVRTCSKTGLRIASTHR